MAKRDLAIVDIDTMYSPAVTYPSTSPSRRRRVIQYRKADGPISTLSIEIYRSFERNSDSLGVLRRERARWQLQVTQPLKLLLMSPLLLTPNVPRRCRPI